MPNKKISQLDQITTINGTEQVPVVQNGLVKRTTTGAFTGRLKELARSVNTVAIQDAKEIGRATLIDGLNAGSVMQQDLLGISAGLHRSPNPITSMFVYDTYKDSDGGAWTKRCQHTSWYNEPLCGRWLGAISGSSLALCETAARLLSNNANDYYQASVDGKFYKLKNGSGYTEVFRGNKAEFPTLVGIVAEAGSVTIYDLTEYGRPMWMRFIAASGVGQSYLPSTSTSTVFVLNGVMVFGGGIYSGIVLTNFVRDSGDWYYSSNSANTGKKANNISRRNSPSVGDANGLVIPQHNINNVAMTVLPDAPVDPVTNLKIPTIVVATAGGITLIKNGSTVYSTTPQTTNFNKVQFTNKGLIASRTVDSIFYYYQKPENISGNFTLSTQSSALDFNRDNTQTILAKNRTEIVRTASNKIQLLKNNESAVTKGLAATITNTYNTGYMPGDIRRSYLSSINQGIQTSVSGAVRSLFLNGEQGVWYDPSDLSTLFQEFAGGDPVTAVEQPVWLLLDKSKGLQRGVELVPTTYTGTVSSGFTINTTSITRNNSSGSINASLTLSQSLTVGKIYAVTATITGFSGDPTVIRLGTINSGAYYKLSTNGTFTGYVQASATNTLLVVIPWAGATGSITITNISCREVFGNHAFQTTGLNRPTLSARYNLLTKTEQFDASEWVKLGGSIAPSLIASGITDPNGGTTAQRWSIGAITASSLYSIFQRTVNRPSTGSVDVKCRMYFKTSVIGDVGKRIYLYFEDTALEGTQYLTLSLDWQYIEVATNISGSTFKITFGSIGDLYGGGNQNGYSVDIAFPDLRVANEGIGLPVYQRVGDVAVTPSDYDTVGFPKYLKFDGSNDCLQTNSINFSNTDKMTMFAGIRKLSNNSGAILAELGANTNNFTGSFFISAPETSVGKYAFASRGAGIVAAISTAYTAPINNILTVVGDISGDRAILRIDGTQSAISTADQGTGNYGNYPLYIGARAGTSIFFNGRIYSLIVRGAATSDSQIAAVEIYIDDQMTRPINNTLLSTNLDTLTQPNGDPIYVSIINKE